MLFCNSGCIYSYYDNGRYTVYRWGFPFLDYSFDVLISWSHTLGCTDGFAVFTFIRFLFGSSILLLLLLYYIYFWLYHLCITSPISCYYHIVHSLSLAWYYTCITMPNLLTCLFMILYKFFSYRINTAPWWFILFSFAVIVDNSGYAYSIDKDMKYMVYRWGFPYLDNPLKVSISWIYLLSPYNWFCRFCTSHHWCLCKFT